MKYYNQHFAKALALSLATNIATIYFNASNLVAQTVNSTININATGNGGPDVKYMRGTGGPGQNGFYDSQQTRDYLSTQTQVGHKLINCIRNLYKDPSKGEFYLENGVAKQKQVAAFTDIRKYAKDLSMVIVSQVGGTPQNVGYTIDPNFENWSTEPNDYAPLPATGTAMTKFQNNFAQWAIDADKAVGTNFHSVWIGTQEIAHTIGHPVGLPFDDNAKKTNIRRYVEYWKPINDKIRAAGAKTGGIQLNSSNSDKYEYCVDYMVSKSLQVDYLTLQFYQWGDKLQVGKAFEALKKYRLTYPNTLLYIDRGMYTKEGDGNVSGVSGETFNLLIGEKSLMDNANLVWGYTLDTGFNMFGPNSDFPLSTGWKTRVWLNTSGDKRRPLTNLPSGVDGFVTTTTKKLRAAIWNSSNQTHNVSLKIANGNYTSTSKVKVQRASGDKLEVITANWNASTQTISGFTLANSQFVLIDIDNATTTAKVGVEETAKPKVYPNPVKESIRVSGNEKIDYLVLQDFSGKQIKKVIGQPEMNVKNIKNGAYLLGIKKQGQKVDFQKIIKE